MHVDQMWVEGRSWRWSASTTELSHNRAPISVKLDMQGIAYLFSRSSNGKMIADKARLLDEYNSLQEHRGNVVDGIFCLSLAQQECSAFATHRKFSLKEISPIPSDHEPHASSIVTE